MNIVDSLRKEAAFHCEDENSLEAQAADKIEALERHLRDVLLTVVARVDLRDRLGPHEREVFEAARVYVNGEG